MRKNKKFNSKNCDKTRNKWFSLNNGMEKNRDNILFFTSEGNELSLASRCLTAISKNI